MFANIGSELEIDLLGVLAKHNLVPKLYLRDRQVLRHYAQCLESGNTPKASKELCADKFYISIKTVEYIVYGKHKEKSGNGKDESDKQD